MAGKVVVACKMPNGLVLRLFRMIPHSEPVMGGGTREVMVAEQFGESVTVKGNAFHTGVPPPMAIVGGYALTPGVDEEFFTQWIEQNKSLDLVKNNLIFAYSKTADTEARAREHKTQRSGLEPVNPNKLPKGIKPGVEVVEA